jgi:hypothetical protein
MFTLLTRSQPSTMFPFCSSPLEGRIAIVTDAGWNAVDVEVPFDERCARVRRNRVVLARICRRQVQAKLTSFAWTTVATQVHREERV